MVSLHSQIKRGSAEVAILSVLESGPMHGYEIAKTIDRETRGALTFNLASFYPMLYRMESRGWIKGDWDTAQGGRRRRFYRLTPSGRKQLSSLGKQWRSFFLASDRLVGVAHA
jgi:PadR family transcriptional regulator, regulatory protein PadR